MARLYDSGEDAATLPETPPDLADTADGGRPDCAAANVEDDTVPRGVDDVIPKVRNDGGVAAWNCDAVIVG